jgi:ubiquinone/menaquinone biosynthesis C-methylase UbiE
MQQRSQQHEEAAMTTGKLWSAAFASAGIEAAQVYDDIMVPRLFQPWADLLLDQIGLQAGDVLLDVACGPGTVARQAATRLGPSGRVTGCDVSPAMLAMARSKPTADASAPIDYLECPADALSVPVAAHDVATCQQGLQFVGDRQSALREMHRALRPGGQLGIAVWCSIDQCPPFAALAAALAKVIGDQIAAAYRDGPWGLAHSDLAAQVKRAGFTVVRASRHQLPVTFDGGPGQLLQTLTASAVAADIATLDDTRKRALAVAVEEAAAPLVESGAVRSETAAQLVIATADP